MDPLTLRWSYDCVFPPLGVTFTFFRCVFIAMSTPVMVPATTVPFFNSTVTVSLLSFMRNLSEGTNPPKEDGHESSVRESQAHWSEEVANSNRLRAREGGGGKEGEDYCDSQKGNDRGGRRPQVFTLLTSLVSP